MKHSSLILAGVLSFILVSGPQALADEPAGQEAPQAPVSVYPNKKEEIILERVPYNEKDFQEYMKRQKAAKKDAEAVRQAKAAANALFAASDGADVLLSRSAREKMPAYYGQYESGLRLKGKTLPCRDGVCRIQGDLFLGSNLTVDRDVKDSARTEDSVHYEGNVRVHTVTETAPDGGKYSTWTSVDRETGAREGGFMVHSAPVSW